MAVGLVPLMGPGHWGVKVAEGDQVLVEVVVGVLVKVKVGRMGEDVTVQVTVRVAVEVAVRAAAVLVGVGVGVFVPLAVGLGDGDEVAVALTVKVAVVVAEKVEVMKTEAVGLGVGEGVRGRMGVWMHSALQGYKVLELFLQEIWRVTRLTQTRKKNVFFISLAPFDGFCLIDTDPWIYCRSKMGWMRIIGLCGMECIRRVPAVLFRLFRNKGVLGSIRIGSRSFASGPLPPYK